MKLFESKHLIALMGVLALVFSGCASGGDKPTDQQFEAPQTVTAVPDKSLFSQALKAQNEGQFESAIKLWESFLAKHPDSFEGHNNLGLVYYTQDMLSQALQEFETAHRLDPVDPKIRKNLARALRFKASMLHENRDYFKTLVILARLEQIVEPEEKQAILFKQEQVEDQIFLQVIKADNSAAYQDFVNRFPDGLNAVRAREYLEAHPNRVAKSTSQTKSWISSGKATASPGGDSSWASSEKPPQYSTASPTATYTPPPPGTKKKKSGDFFGTDSAAVEDIAEESVAAPQDNDPVAAIPFEDFEKPERSGGEQTAARTPAESKDSQRVPAEFNPLSGDPDEVAATGLDTLPDLKPAPVPVIPAEVEAPESTDTAAGDIKMKTVEQETTEAATASAESTIEPTNNEVAKQEEPETAVAQAETAQPETVESESERIARIVKEEIAKAESAPPEQALPEQTQPEPVQEMKAEASTEEKPMEVASFDPEDQGAKQETPVESTPVETAPPDPEESISQETVSETVAALVPSPPMETSSMDASTPQPETLQIMVVVQMSEGSTLNVRSQPSTQGEILGYLENGDMMPFMSESGDWYQIEIEEGLTGWVSKSYSTTRTVNSTVASPAEETELASAQETELTSELAPVQSDQSQSDPQQASGAMVVVTVREGSTLNVRSLPSSSGAVVDMLFRGDKLPLLKEEGDWYQVQFEDETTGWISKKFSVIEGGTQKASFEAPLPAPKAKKKHWNTPAKKEKKEMVTTVVVVKVPEGSSLNVRTSPSSQSKVIGSLKRGEMRPLLEEMDEWYQVELQDGQSGWISKKFSGKMEVDSSFAQNP